MKYRETFLPQKETEHSRSRNQRRNPQTDGGHAESGYTRARGGLEKACMAEPSDPDLSPGVRIERRIWHLGATPAAAWSLLSEVMRTRDKFPHRGEEKFQEMAHGIYFLENSVVKRRRE